MSVLIGIAIILLISLMVSQIKYYDQLEAITHHGTFRTVLDYIDVIVKIYEARQNDLYINNLYVYADGGNIVCGVTVISNYMERQLNILEGEYNSPNYALKNHVIATVYEDMINFLMRNTPKDYRNRFYDLSMSVDFAEPIESRNTGFIVISMPQMRVPDNIGEYQYIDCLYRECRQRYPRHRTAKGRMARLFMYM